MPYDRTAYYEQRNQRRLQNAGPPEEAVNSAGYAPGEGWGAQHNLSGAEVALRASETNASTQRDVEASRAGSHQYEADKKLEGVQYAAADRKDPFVDENGEALPGYAQGGPVAAGQDVVVGDGGQPEVFRPSVPGTIIPGQNLGKAMRRSDWIMRQKEAGANERARLAHAGQNKLIDFQIQEKMREHNLAKFNSLVDAKYPGAPDENGRVTISPEAKLLKSRYQQMAEMDPDKADEALGAGMKLNQMIGKYKTQDGIAVANDLRRSGKIDDEYYKRLVGGDPKTVLDAENHFHQNPEAANLHPGLLTGQPTPSGMPGLTGPGYPDSTPGIHTTPAGDRIRVVSGPGFRREELISRGDSAPSPEQLDKWAADYAKTPEGQIPQGYFRGGDGSIYKATDRTGLPTKVAEPVGAGSAPALGPVTPGSAEEAAGLAAAVPAAPAAAPAPPVSLAAARPPNEAGDLMGSVWTPPPAPVKAPGLTRPDVEEAAGLFGVPPNRAPSLVNAAPGAGGGGGAGWPEPRRLEDIRPPSVM